MKVAEHSQVIEEYLLALYKIDRSNEKAKAVTLSTRLQTSPPTVHATISRMQRDGLVNVNKTKIVTLTKEGQKVAEDIAYRHNLSEYFLCNTLGIPWYEVHQHAHQLEHFLQGISGPIFGHDVRRVLCTNDFVEGDRTRADFLLAPEVLNIQVPDLAHATAATDPNGSTGIAPYVNIDARP